MSIRFSCPSCKSIYTVSTEYAGKRTECKVCGQRLEIPSPQRPNTVLGEVVPVVEPLDAEPPPRAVPPSITVTCPSCGFQAEAPSTFQAREATCPKCETAFTPNQPSAEGGFDFSQRSSALAVYQPPRRERDYRDDEEDDRPRRRRRRRRYVDDDYGFRCPYCDTSARPYWRSQISAGGWVVFALMLLFCWPLFWIGLLITEQYSVCSRCGMRVGHGG